MSLTKIYNISAFNLEHFSNPSTIARSRGVLRLFHRLINVKSLGSTIGILFRTTKNGIREHTDPFFHIGDRDERG